MMPLRAGAVRRSRRAKPVPKSRATANPVNTPEMVAAWSEAKTKMKAV